LDVMRKLLTVSAPVQYILGGTVFYDLPFVVSQQVLIPRPETEELVRWVLEDNEGKKLQMLDIGTGSGCIAVTLAKNLHLAKVSGCDIDEKAVEISRKNAILNEVQVSFFVFNVLNRRPAHNKKYHVLVSNPPYVRESERTLMHANVLNYEPHRALFVPDDHPLLFYEAIADLGHKILLPEGTVYCEINENLAEETLQVFHARNYSNALIRRDINGKRRMIKAVNK